MGVGTGGGVTGDEVGNGVAYSGPAPPFEGGTFEGSGEGEADGDGEALGVTCAICTACVNCPSNRAAQL